MAGRWERTEKVMEELGHLLGNMAPQMPPSNTQSIINGMRLRALLNNLDQQAFEAGVARGIEMMKEGQ